MSTDPITEEIRAIRRALAERQGNDVSRILAETRQREATSGRRFVRLPKRPSRLVVAGKRGVRGEDVMADATKRQDLAERTVLVFPRGF